MAGGDHAVARLGADNLPLGWVVTSSGRISKVTEPGVLSVQYPFPIMELIKVDNALTQATRQSRARFAAYIGDLGSDTTARAREILADVPTPNNAILLAVSPNERAIEVVYGAELRGRGADTAAPLGVSAAAAAFKEGNLIDGLVSAIRVMSAGISRP